MKPLWLAGLLALFALPDALASPSAEPPAPSSGAARWGDTPAQVQGAPRPRIGLVLGGGGARGAAHIGVLEVLERLRVPVDCVAGTSMGALVAGAWASGLGPERMRRELARADWGDMFVDSPDYTEQSFRGRRLSQRFLPGTEVGIQDGSAVAAPGLVTGQKIKLFFNQLVGADTGERELQQLPLPVSMIATDIGNGERVVLRDGSVTMAMRASMSVPTLLAPLEYRGRRLVDGGLVDNVPIREVRERCGADVVIAVNVGSPPLKPEQVTGLLSVTAQMVALLTEQNVQASLATLKPGDIYIQPALDGITAADFARHAETADRGRAAAEALAPRLAALAVDEAAYAAWQRSVSVRDRDVPRVDEIRVGGLRRVQPELVSRWLQQQAGAPLDAEQLRRDLLRAFGDGWYEYVDYSLVREGQRNVLSILPVEKSWGPDYLRLGLRLDSNLRQGSSYQLRAGYQRTWLNAFGGELLLVGELGSATGASVEWYQPVVRGQGLFADAQAEYRRERNDYWLREQRIAEYRSARTRLDLTLGVNLALFGQLRAGWRESKVTNALETGLDVLSVLPERSTGGWLVVLDLDRRDQLYTPRSGWSALASWFNDDRNDYAKLSLELRGALPLADWVLAGRASWVDSPRGELPFNEAARLGGFLNLTGYATGQLIGDRVAYLGLRGERIIGRLPLGLRGDMRAGIALEGGYVGRPYALQKRDGWIGGLALYLGGETPLGPVFVGIGSAAGGATNGYLFIGAP